MYSTLGDAVLKTGERMEIALVQGPEPAWGPRLTHFLKHKGPSWLVHIADALDGPLDDLQSRFYLGLVDGEPISQIMIVGDRGAGILGHVFTQPEHRQKGAARSLMSVVMDDSGQAGFRVLTLGTGFESHPYWIYHSFGFRSVRPGSGEMLWEREPGAVDDLLQPGPAHIRPVRWDDWGYFNLLAESPVSEGEPLPRSALMNLKGQGSVEGPFIQFQLRRRQEPRIQAQALVSDTGAAVGWALFAPAVPGGEIWRLDVFTHPHFLDRRRELIAAVRSPESRL